MATQVVMFSVLLFGTSGVVLDFGRVYSEHSIMQSYTDQAALAAAAELDRTTGSVDRAIDAVFGGQDSEGNTLAAPLARSAVFSAGDSNEFNISHLVFLSDMADDSGVQSSLSGIEDNIVYVAFSDGGRNGNIADAEAEARYVIAVAEERSVRNSLISLINAGTESTASSSNVVRTVAAATRRVSYCGEFSNLVMCSPQSSIAANSGGDPDQDTGEFMANYEGARFAHITDTTGGSETHRLYRRMNALMASQVGVESICDGVDATGNPLYPGYDANNSAAVNEMYQAICHLAAATPRDHCVGDRLEIIAAEPEAITTALNVAFDMWDAPIDEVLTWQGTSLEPTLQLFQPDLVITKGKIYDDATTRAATNGSTNPDYGLDSTNSTSRMHYSYYTVGTETSEDNFNLNLPNCFRSSANQASCGIGASLPGIAPYIGLPATPTALNSFYSENYPGHRAANGNSDLDNSINSFFDLYLQEPNMTHGQAYGVTGLDFSTFPPQPIFGPSGPAGAPFTPQATVNGSAVYEDGSLASLTPSPNLAAQVGDHQNYPLAVDPDDGTLRRRMSIPLVNCQTMSVNDEGVLEADVLDFVDMFLLQPPKPVCVSGDEHCNNAFISSATVFTEFVEQSTYVKNTFPELVN